jgi:hypothetical protein
VPTIRMTIGRTSLEGPRGGELHLVAWPLDNDPSNVTPRLAAAVSAVFPGLSVLWVTIDKYGEVRMLGDVDPSLEAIKLGLENNLWHLIDDDLPDGDAPPANRGAGAPPLLAALGAADAVDAGAQDGLAAVGDVAVDGLARDVDEAVVAVVGGEGGAAGEAALGVGDLGAE